MLIADHVIRINVNGPNTAVAAHVLAVLVVEADVAEAGTVALLGV